MVNILGTVLNTKLQLYQNLLHRRICTLLIPIFCNDQFSLIVIKTQSKYFWFLFPTFSRSWKVCSCWEFVLVENYFSLWLYGAVGNFQQKCFFMFLVSFYWPREMFPAIRIHMEATALFFLKFSVMFLIFSQYRVT